MVLPEKHLGSRARPKRVGSDRAPVQERLRAGRRELRDLKGPDDRLDRGVEAPRGHRRGLQRSSVGADEVLQEECLGALADPGSSGSVLLDRPARGGGDPLRLGCKALLACAAAARLEEYARQEGGAQLRGGRRVLLERIDPSTRRVPTVTARTFAGWQSSHLREVGVHPRLHKADFLTAAQDPPRQGRKARLHDDR